MSDKSKGDTSQKSSSTLLQPPQRIVKNPLLSANVTGLTFDDFPNKPQLLPCAPPIVHAPAPTPTLLSREPKSLVTVGSASSHLDTENLDEINLNASGDRQQYHNQPQQQQQPFDTSTNDANANEIWDPQNTINNDSILSQAASSFSALPSVASSVFSTFSKRIYAGSSSSSRERTPVTDSGPPQVPDFNQNPVQQQQQQFDVTPSQQQQTYFQPPLPPLTVGGNHFEGVGAPPLLHPSTSGVQPPVAAPPAEPPKFYTPSELPPTSAPLPPPSVGGAGANTYRLSAKKKIYAPIPGLSDQTQQFGAPSPFSVEQSSFAPPPPAQLGDPYSTALPSTDVYGQPLQQQQYSLGPPAAPPHSSHKPEERKAGGLFSLTSGVLQNLTGLVQSAAGTLTGAPANPTFQEQQQQQQQYPSYQPTATGGDVNFFGVSSGAQPPPPSNFYSAPTVDQTNFFASGAPPTTTYPPSGPPPIASFDPPKSVHSPAVFFGAGPIPLASTKPPPPLQNPTIFTPPTESSTIGSANSSASAITPVPTFSRPDSETQAPNPFLPPTTAQQQQQAPLASALPTQFLPPPIRPPSASGVITQSIFPLEQTTANPLLAPPSVTSVTQPTTQQLLTSPLPTTTTSEPIRPPSTGGTSTQPPPIVVPPPLFQTPPPTGLLQQPPIGDPSKQYEPPSTVAAIPPLASGIFTPIGGPTNQLPPPPLAAAGTNQPPPSATGSTSFRLQKGTRLYKSPLTSAETAPTYVAAPPAIGLTSSSDTTTQSVFNPFNQSAEAQGSATEAPQTHSVPTYFLPTSSEPQSVPLFVADSEIETTATKHTQEEAEPQEEIAKELLGNFVGTTAPPVETVKAVLPAEDQVTAPDNDPLDSALQQLSLQSQAEPVLPVDHQTAPPQLCSELFQPTAEHFGASTLTTIPLQRTVESTGSLLPPPPFGQTSSEPFGLPSNPYRKEPLSAVPPTQPVAAATTQPSLQNFFTPLACDDIKSAGDFNFFTPQPIEKSTAKPSEAGNFFESQTKPATELATASAPVLTDFVEPLPTVSADSKEAETHIAPPPIGFENVASEVRNSNSNSETSAVTEHTFSNFFNQSSNSTTVTQNHTQVEYCQPKDPHTFFDTFAGTGQVGEASAPAVSITTNSESSFFQPDDQQQQLQETTNSSPQRNEYQRIQNFFNNPPPKESSSGAGDLNYDLVHSGLGVKNLQDRSLTPASNLVEPPSSSCSEFSLTAPKAAETSSISNCEAVADTSSSSPVKHYEELPEEILQELRKMAKSEKDSGTSGNATPTAVPYTPAVKHWFYKRLVSSKYVWTPFSHYDNALLETTLTMGANAPNIVAVEGGRYDVNIQERRKTPVYWESEPIEVRRCSWFYKGTDSKYVPYEEETADQLEAEYKLAVEKNDWHKKIILSQGEQVVFHGATVIVHFLQQQNADAWGGSSQITTRPRMVKRDLDDFQIEQGESQRVDHLLLMVHGIGAACDLKLRTVEEVVDEFRGIAQQLVTSHYKNSTDLGVVGRVEVLPISWHFHLHSAEMGIDEKLKSITLESIPKLRNFTNDTLLDVLFYTSPTYCQKIMNTVAMAMNDTYQKYRDRHPDFSGGVSLAGHSLGSLILFDLLCHQHPIKELEDGNLENPDQPYGAAHEQLTKITNPPMNASISHEEQVSYTMGPAGTGQPFIHYTQLSFQPKKFFALGSPIGMFVTIRGIDKLGFDFRLPTCPGFYNIFHPFDPVAYRIEALVNPDMSGVRPVLIPHHKGRKRMHLELKETMTRVGADLKQRFLDTVKTTIGSVNFLGTSPSTTKKDEDSMKEEVEKVLTMQMQLEHQDNSSSENSQLQRQRTDSISTVLSEEMVEIDLPLGKLNDSKRVDYVLQEAPLEFFNEYLFALSSHVCYWDSEDTILFVMKEIYSGLGISPDSQVPQQSMTIERPNSRSSLS